ncbi:helix-turn-helix domain-containing protein [Streptomyces sp. TLI_146]|uniref:nSTAND1 domain-containing NTPase n=1 Tax=Streptomyces sp. TLI_146 TaxID=1938858 RepID=UPI000CA819DD|nr:helix-turn-helix domain-containing protein [Streptomyces sp. TLI_146]PKV82988.1 WD domain G-beta repeat uncharacterized protein [Streptomyces sp. TLI_146]
MARPEKPLDPDAGPVAEFAHALRHLRRDAGLSYRAMAQKTGYSVTTLSQAAAGEKLPTLPVALAYTEACGAGLDRATWEQRWHEAEQAVRRASAAVRTEKEADGPAPYRGLARYEPSDATLFFGRDTLTNDLTTLVARERVSVVIGPSGSGKSSLLRAGLIPRLQHPDPDHTTGIPIAALRICTPGPHPANTHAKLFTSCDTAATGEGDADTVVIVDQFEEVFTLCQDADEREAFLDLILTAREPGSRLRVVLGVRADFYSHCLHHARLVDVLREAALPVGPMSPDELREAITKPATAQGLIVERALTTRLIDDVCAEPGALPLMSHALLETWRHRTGRTLTLDAYQIAGGLDGAVGHTAETLYATLDHHQATLTRQILLRLITPGDNAPDTRRPIERTELDFDSPSDTTAVLEALAHARLITLDDDHIDLAHEALITAWPRLRTWIDEARARLRLHRQLTDAARTWQQLGRDAGEVWRGPRLTAAETAFPGAGQHDELNVLEREFLTASLAARTQAQHAAARSRRRTRTLLATLAALVTLALLAGTIAWQQNRSRAEQHRESVARSAAALAESLRLTDPQTAMHLSLAAWEIAHIPESQAALLTSAHTLDQDAYDVADVDEGSGLFLDRYGRILITRSTTGSVVRRDADNRRTLSSVSLHDRIMDVSPNGETLLVSNQNGVRLWRPDTVERAAVPFAASALAVGRFQADGRVVVLTDSYSTPTLQVWNVADQRLLFRDTLKHPLDPAHTAVSDDARYLAACPPDGTLQVWDMAARRRLQPPPPRYDCPRNAAFQHLHFLRGGHSLAVVDDIGMRSWDLATGHQEWRKGLRGINDAAFSADGRFLATATPNEIFLWKTSALSSALLRYPMAHETARSLRLDTTRGLLRYVDARSSTTVRSLDLRSALHAAESQTPVDTARLSPDAKVLATSVRRGDKVFFQLRDAATGRVSTDLPPVTCPRNSAQCRGRIFFSGDSRTLAYGLVTQWPSYPPIHFALFDVARRRNKPTLALTPANTSPRGIADVALTSSGTALLAIRLDQPSQYSLERWSTLDGTVSPIADNVGASFLLPPTDHQAVTKGGLVTDLQTGRTTVHPHANDLQETTATTNHGIAAGDYPRILFWPDTTRQDTAPFSALMHSGDAPDTSDTSNTPVTVSAIAVSPDGHSLAAAATNRTLQLWDVHSRRPLGIPLPADGGFITSLAFSQDGRTLYSASQQTPWHAYPLDPQRLIAAVCTRTHTPLTRTEWKQLIPDTPYRKTC